MHKIYEPLDVDALITFLLVHMHGGFSAAARRLNRTQPAISRRIELLEHQLGARLFERSRGRIILSEAGKVLLPHAERVLVDIREARDAVSTLTARKAGPVCLAVVGTLADRGLTATMRRFAEACPAADLTIRTARSAEVSNLVRLGEATLGLRYERDRSDDLAWRLVAVERLIVVCASRHPLAGRTIGALSAIRDEHWIAFPEVPAQPEISAAHVFAVFLAHGLGEVPWTPIDSLTAQKRLVEAGFGVALMSERNVAEELAAGTVRTIAVEGLDATIPIFAVTRKGGLFSAAAQHLHELICTSYAAADAGGE